MLYAYYTDGSAIELHVGCKRLAQAQHYTFVTSIQADGDELDMILGWGYPDHGTEVQVYVGNTARQIVANWH